MYVNCKETIVNGRGGRKMIKIAKMHEVIMTTALSEKDKVVRDYFVAKAVQQFGEGLKGGGKVPYVQNVLLSGMDNITNYLVQKGTDNLNTVNATLKGAKKFDVDALSDEYKYLTGLLSFEVLIGRDRANTEERSVSLYTRNEKLIRALAKEGAFSSLSAGDVDKKLEDIEKKLGTAPLAKDGASLTYIRIDFEEVSANEVSLSIVIPKFRPNIAELEFYSYPAFSVLAGEIVKVVKSKSILVQLQTSEGIKERKVAFTADKVNALYKGFEPKMVQKKLKSAKPGWDIVGYNLKGYNLESSLYERGYTAIALEDIVHIGDLALSDVDKTQYAVNYDDLKGIFKTSVKRWTLANYESFAGLDTSEYPLKAGKEEAAIKWVEGVGHKELYTLMSAQPELFGDVVERLAAKDKINPKVLKQLEEVELVEDMEERKKQIDEMLSKGLCLIVKSNKKSNKQSESLASNNKVLLARMLGQNYIEKYESVGTKLAYLKNLMTKTHILKSKEEILAKVYEMGLNDYIDAEALSRQIDESILAQNQLVYDKKIQEGVAPKAAALAEGYTSVLTDGVSQVLADNTIRSSNRTAEGLITYRKVYADSPESFYGSVNVRNVVGVWYAPMK